MESALAQHPDIASLEERNTLQDAVREFMVDAQSLSDFAAMRGDALLEYRLKYWSVVKSYGGAPEGKIFIDKNPFVTLELAPGEKAVPEREDHLRRSRPPRCGSELLSAHVQPEPIDLRAAGPAPGRRLLQSDPAVLENLERQTSPRSAPVGLRAAGVGFPNRGHLGDPVHRRGLAPRDGRFRRTWTPGRGDQRERPADRPGAVHRRLWANGAGFAASWNLFFPC